MTPIVSVLIPSRNRLRFLETGVVSWIDTADNPNNIQIIVRAHLDDSETVDWLLSVGRSLGVQVIAGEDMDGHLSMGEFINCMAACSSGDWLMPVSDDFLCQTQGWEKVLQAACRNPRREFMIRHFTTLNKEGERPPIITRGLYNAIGSFGHTSHGDVYIDTLGWQLGINQMEALPVTLVNRLGPPPAAGIWEAGHARYMSEEVQTLLKNDAKKLKALMK